MAALPEWSSRPLQARSGTRAGRVHAGQGGGVGTGQVPHAPRPSEKLERWQQSAGSEATVSHPHAEGAAGGDVPASSAGSQCTFPQRLLCLLCVWSGLEVNEALLAAGVGVWRRPGPQLSLGEGRREGVPLGTGVPVTISTKRSEVGGGPGAGTAPSLSQRKGPRFPALTTTDAFPS